MDEESEEVRKASIALPLTPEKAIADVFKIDPKKTKGGASAEGEAEKEVDAKCT